MKVPPRWEENLRRFVVKLGRSLESLIAKMKASHFARRLPKMEPVLAIDGQLAAPKIRELAQHTSLHLLGELLPPFIDKTVVVIGNDVATAVPLCQDKGASTIIQVELENSDSPLPGGDDALRIHCQPQKLALRSHNADAVVALLAAPFQGELDQVLQELARVLVVGGDILIADYHPFGLYAKRGSHRLRGSLAKGVEEYYRMARGVGIDLTDCREGFCDARAAAFFVTTEEKQVYRRIKDSPLVIAFRGRKMGAVK